MNLKDIKPGLYGKPAGFFKQGSPGWVTVSTSDNFKDQLDFMWTSGKTTHWSLGTCAKNLAIDSSGNIVCYMESAISFWIKWGYGRGTEVEYQRALDYKKFLEQFFDNYVEYRTEA